MMMMVVSGGDYGDDDENDGKTLDFSGQGGHCLDNLSQQRPPILHRYHYDNNHHRHLYLPILAVWYHCNFCK